MCVAHASASVQYWGEGSRIGGRNDGRGLGACEGFGGVNEVGSLLDNPFDGVDGFTEACVEAVPVEDVPSFGVASLQFAHFGMVLG